MTAGRRDAARGAAQPARRAREIEHRGRRIDSGHPVPAPRQFARDHSGAAPEIDDRCRAHFRGELRIEVGLGTDVVRVDRVVDRSEANVVEFGNHRGSST
jgi:hypothetical protein